jgi:hypothetical protein
MGGVVDGQVTLRSIGCCTNLVLSARASSHGFRNSTPLSSVPPRQMYLSVEV